MKRIMIWLMVVSLFWVAPAWTALETLSLVDVHHVMQKMFAYHVENKNFNPALVRRCMKIYIEQFDPEKCYLLEKEALPYLQLSDQQLQAMIQRLQNRDYSDFFTLNEVIQTSILRAQKLRKQIASELSSAQISEDVPSSMLAPSAYADSEETLRMRQKGRMLRFYAFHKQRTL
ncbi:MAG: hypothetical protein K2X08_04615, partial [Chlamydiales bacterium]|nr:hypothetical protein [Chlamydiales bacterium]